MLAEPKCYTRKCKYFIGVKQDNEEEETERNVCKAFPDGIPDEIAYGNEKCPQNPYLLTVLLGGKYHAAFD
jgi:hypothetical protein